MRRFLALFFGLLLVSAVGVERGRPLPSCLNNDQYAGAAREATQVTDIRQMRDQQRVNFEALKSLRQPSLPALVVHFFNRD